MRIFWFAIIITAFGLTSSSCRKETPYVADPSPDTLFPKPYLPIYPGSWWTYVYPYDNATFTDNAEGYVLDELHYGQYHSQKYYVPKWRGCSFFGYTFLNASASQIATSELMEEQWVQWVYVPNSGGDPRYNSYTIYREVDSIGITHAVNSVIYTDVIKVHERYDPSGTNPIAYHYYYYYAKDVGLIEKKDAIGNTVYYLLAYHINN